MLMKNPYDETVVEHDLEFTSESYSPRDISSSKMLIGQIALILLFVIAIVLRSLSGA
tara:strand:+ start:104596 stop:104766 length:171 start_codon:yes stop_codon:yes gene_type:complete